MPIANISSDVDLVAALQRVELDVPPRSEGRIKEHVERFVISHLLATLSKAGRLAYPLSLDCRERPDFLLSQANKRTGVEITEAVPTDFAQYSTHVARKLLEGLAQPGGSQAPDELLQPGHFRLEKDGLTGDKWEKLTSLPKDRLTARPFYGDDPEQRWASFLERVISEKLEKLRQTGFSKFDENWLAIYDNFPISFGRHGALALLRRKLSKHWQRARGFDTIFIERGTSVFVLTRDGLENFAVNSLWP